MSKSPKKPKKGFSKSIQQKFKRSVDQLDLPEVSKRQAFALKYDLKKDKAPRLVASGKGAFADTILALAEEHRIPFYEDKGLTKLMEKLHVSQEIPAELYSLVAEMFAFVYQLDQLSKKKRQRRKRR